MDFFEAQAHAKKRTARLVVLFGLAVLSTIVALYFVAVIVTNAVQDRGGHRHHREYVNGRTLYVREAALAEPMLFWQPPVLFWAAGGTLAVIGIASLIKWGQYSAGGAGVAESVGGRRVDPRTSDLAERRLLNVVEEMAIASGIPAPAVYVLDDEEGINAFAAGLTTADAVVAVTHGTMKKLTRDELQGVIGHEFSHILNGDMRLNLRIGALVFGILAIALIGRGLLWSVRNVRGGRNTAGVIVALMVLGLALMVVGYVGYFFGRVIQAAVSRQREFLADASSVQFTRNPGGITGALKKIGGYALGSALQTHKAAEIGHFFFAQGFGSTLAGFWATHPPLGERIRAIDPQWDGQLFEPAEVVDITRESFATAGFGGRCYSPDETLRRVQEAAPLVPPPRTPTPVPFKPARIVADVGALTESHFRHALALLDSVPTRLREAVRTPESAPALVYGLLLTGTKEERDRQVALVAQHAGAPAAAALADLRAALSVLDPVARLPLLQLALPALRDLRGEPLDRFVTTLDELVHADGQVTPFEYAMQKMLLRQLDLARRPVQSVQFDSFDAVRNEIAVVLSAFAHLSPKDSTGAFAEGAAQIPVLANQVALLAPEACGLEQVDAALDKLAASSPPIKQRLLVAAGHVIASDGTVSVDEGELFRALAATLDCPMPAVGLAA